MRRDKGGEIRPLRGTVSLGWGRRDVSHRDLGRLSGVSFEARGGGTVHGGDRSTLLLVQRENMGNGCKV